MDPESGIVYKLVAAPAHKHDVTQADVLLHGDQTDVFADVGYACVSKRDENQGRMVGWHAAMRLGKRRTLPMTSLSKVLEFIGHTK